MTTAQFTMPFLDQVDREEEARRETERLQQRHSSSLARLQLFVQRYPPSAYECDIMLGGIRLARFVGEWECQKCPLAPTDHTLGWMFDSNVCVKDAYKHGYPKNQTY